MKERYNRMMEQISLDEQTRQEMEGRLWAGKKLQGRTLLRVTLIAAAVTVVLCGGAFAAYTAFVGEIKTPLEGQTAEVAYNEDLDRTYLKLMGDGSPELEVVDGRMRLTLFDEIMDITDFCDEENYWVWDETDEKGNRQVLVIGGTSNDWGWGYFLWPASTGTRKVGVVEHLDRHAVWGQKALAEYCPGESWWTDDDRVVLEKFDTPLKGVKMTIREDSDGSRSAAMNASGSGYSEPRVEIVDGRMMLTLYDEVIDITASCSKEAYWEWDVTDEIGVRQVLVIGGTPEDWSWIYFLYAEEGTAADIVYCYGVFIDADDLWAEAALAKYYPEQSDYFELLTSIS